MQEGNLVARELSNRLQSVVASTHSTVMDQITVSTSVKDLTRITTCLT